MLSITHILSFLALLSLAFTSSSIQQRQWTCTVPASGSNTTDDAPAIIAAFNECNLYNGRVIFTNTTYYVNTVMNISGLKNVDVDIKGTLTWSKNTTYWLGASLAVGYQNQSTALILGGDNININGFGYGTFDGNGQTWYDLVKGVSNYPRRPHGVSFRLTNSVVEGMRFVQSQMWTMTVFNSKNVTLDSIYVNSTTHDGYPARNTDGADTIYSSNITFSNWIVDNGDDSISLKANSTDIVIKDCTFYRGLGVAIGSIGQYLGVFETVERVSVSGIKLYGTLHAAYFKTWTGEQVGYPPNGGGGGLGYAQDISFTDMDINGSRDVPFSITQCTTFSGTTGNCTSSLFQIRDVTISGLSGTIADGGTVATMDCAAVTCPFITIENVNLTNGTRGVAATRYSCSNVRNVTGFTCD